MESSGENVEYLPKSPRIPWIICLLERKVRPKALVVPLQLGLGIQMRQHFGSMFLNDSLCKHGFCVSYIEVLKYERCAAVHQGTKIPGVSESS